MPFQEEYVHLEVERRAGGGCFMILMENRKSSLRFRDFPGYFAENDVSQI